MPRKMKELKIVVLIVAGTLALVFGTAVFQRVRRSNSVKNTASVTKNAVDADMPRDWRRIEIQDGVVVYVPPDLRSEVNDHAPGYRGFRNETMQVLMDYGRFNEVTTCIVQNGRRIDHQVILSDTRIDGREARIEKIDRMPFNLDDDAKLAGKGFEICVPDVGDGAHEFAVVGKYKSDQDYQTLYRIIDSIKFRSSRS